MEDDQGGVVMRWWHIVVGLACMGWLVFCGMKGVAR